MNKLAPHQMDILLVLAGGSTHGYEIMKRIDDLRGKPNSLGPAQLYTGLQKLLDLKLIHEVASDDPRRRVYAISMTGRAARDAYVAEQSQFLERARVINEGSNKGVELATG